jgi:hypothetical protein
MKYFTPELYQRLNSFDLAEAERADEEWNQAEVRYKKRLARIRPELSPTAAKLAELCLHDALVISRSERTELAPTVSIVSVAVGDEIVSLFYSLGARAAAHEAPTGWRFSKLDEQWLYDEIDVTKAVDSRPMFAHRILFSTGVTMEIPFHVVIIHRFKMPEAVKQSA